MRGSLLPIRSDASVVHGKHGNTLISVSQDDDGRLGPGELEVLMGMSSGVDISDLDTDADGYLTHEEMVASINRQIESGGGR